MNEDMGTRVTRLEERSVSIDRRLSNIERGVGALLGAVLLAILAAVMQFLIRGGFNVPGT